MSKKGLEVVVYIIAAILMIIRIDFWWWGTKIHPIIAGWLTIPMLYHFAIFCVGYALVLIICFVIWDDKADLEAGE
jgi:hypothetical protein